MVRMHAVGDLGHAFGSNTHGLLPPCTIAIHAQAKTAGFTQRSTTFVCLQHIAYLGICVHLVLHLCIAVTGPPLLSLDHEGVPQQYFCNMSVMTLPLTQHD